MAQVSRPNNYSDGTPADPTEVNDDFDTLYDEFNGNIELSNLNEDDIATVFARLSALADVATSGKYGDLTEIPSEFTPESHGNDKHSEDYSTTTPGDVTSSNWGDYEIQKNGSDGSGIINFKT